MSDSLTRYLTGYNDYHKFHREAVSLSIVRNASYEPPQREKKQYAAGWKQAKADLAQAEEAERAATSIRLGS
jgi:hypothetical protein